MQVLGYHRSKSRPRESSSQAVKIEMDSVRPDPLAPLEEYRCVVEFIERSCHKVPSLEVISQFLSVVTPRNNAKLV